MKRNSIIKYGLSSFSLGLAVYIFIGTSKIDIPSCENKKVLGSVATLWKQQALKNEAPIQDGRLKGPIELPLRIADGRACTADLVVNGSPTGSINYTIMRPLQGAAGIVTLE